MSAIKAAPALICCQVEPPHTYRRSDVPPERISQIAPVGLPCPSVVVGFALDTVYRPPAVVARPIAASAVALTPSMSAVALSAAFLASTAAWAASCARVMAVAASDAAACAVVFAALAFSQIVWRPGPTSLAHSSSWVLVLALASSRAFAASVVAAARASAAAFAAASDAACASAATFSAAATLPGRSPTDPSRVPRRATASATDWRAASIPDAASSALSKASCALPATASASWKAFAASVMASWSICPIAPVATGCTPSGSTIGEDIDTTRPVASSVTATTAPTAVMPPSDRPVTSLVGAS